MTTKSELVDLSEPIDIVVATGNAGKLIELRVLLGSSFRIHSAHEVAATMPEETGSTFMENAVLKARDVARQTGMITIADDSGLEVRALGGQPGVYSARYAGADASDNANRQKLLHAMEIVDDGERAARFVSAIAIAFSPEDVETSEGTCAGVITREERGQGGFGYDSIFEVPSGKTMAELTSAEKNAISHRGQAMEAARTVLARRLSVLKERSGDGAS